MSELMWNLGLNEEFVNWDAMLMGMSAGIPVL
jgi:hypothetical protein